MSLLLAIEQLQAEVELLEAVKPPEGSPAWFIFRAKSTALSMLKAAAARHLLDPIGFENYRRACRRYFTAEVGDE